MTRTIAVAGKGGTGKSTIASLIILDLCRNGHRPVLAVDADPDANLGLLLGVAAEQTIGDLREDLRKEMGNLPAGMAKASYFEAGLHQLVAEADGFDLITMGQGEGSGCYCSLNNLIRKFSENLMPSYTWAVFDNEAGLEHISRRTTSNIDALLVVVNDNPLSMNTAENIAHLAGSMDAKVRRQYVVTNMTREDRKAHVLERVSRLGLEHIADIPMDPKLAQVVAEGRPLSELTDSAAQQCIGHIVKRIGEQHGPT